MKDGKTVAIVPGSFDPITYGHISLVKYASEKYDTVFLAVMINDQKKYMFTLEQRKSISAACFQERENIEVISSDGWLWMLAKELGACAIVKGYRNQTDLEYEKKMAEFNEKHYPEAKTILLQADDALVNLSSTSVRDLINQGIEINDLIPQKALDVIKAL